jgi:hypothetical protein
VNTRSKARSSGRNVIAATRSTTGLSETRTRADEPASSIRGCVDPLISLEIPDREAVHALLLPPHDR